MPYDLKYGRVTLEHQRRIADDELVVIFRAGDAALPHVIAEYIEHCARLGSPRRHLDALRELDEHVYAWQLEHGSRIPSSDPIPNTAADMAHPAATDQETPA